MADGLQQCEFLVLRYVPHAVKEEFVNIGVVLLGSPQPGVAVPEAEVCFTRDWHGVRCLDPDVDIEMLQALEAELRERLRQGGADRERILHLLRDSFSNTVQCSVPKGCLTESPAEELTRLAQMYLESPKRARVHTGGGRSALYARMREAFQQAGVWQAMSKDVAVARYTRAGDPLKLDCGYSPHDPQTARRPGAPTKLPNGVIRFFHAVPLANGVTQAKALAFSYPQIREGVARVEAADTELTAIVEDDLDRGDEEVAFALETFARSEILVAATTELGRLAETARRELRL